jgi:hypothetical protein
MQRVAPGSVLWFEEVRGPGTGDGGGHAKRLFTPMMGDMTRSPPSYEKYCWPLTECPCRKFKAEGGGTSAH